MEPDYDVLIIGSGFGGSVSALRLTEKGYRVGVLEAGRRFADEDFPKTSWHVRDYLFTARRLLRHLPVAPAARCPGAERRRRRWWLARLRQHAVPAATGRVRRPAV